MAADEEIAGHEIAGEAVNPTPILPPTIDSADTDEEYAGHEYAGEKVPPVSGIYPGFEATTLIKGDSCDSYAEVEYAGDCVDETAVFPTLPTTNVEEFDTSVGRLGCGTPLVFITSRCNSSMTCQLEMSDITKLSWTRRLDEVSEALVEIGLSGDSAQTCCQCLATVEPWCHELHIWRDGDEVWVGPIEAIKYERERITIKARDALAWLAVRIPPSDVEFQTTPSLGIAGPASDLTDIAEYIITRAFAQDVAEGKTCEVDHLFMTQTGEVIEFFSEAYNQTSLEILLDVVGGTKLNVTVLGRTIILTSSNNFSLTPLGLLNDEHIMGDVEITKDGNLQANRVFVHYEGDGGFPATDIAPDRYCYSLLERFADGSGLQRIEDAQVAATGHVLSSYITPRILDIPAGSRLSPDTPWTINQMVPGTKVDVAITRLCIQLTQSFTLIGINVEYSESEGELIGIELKPINSAAGG
jgi:hypothetical protein